ncbi:Glycine/D-amino acid oxidase [Tessaracoccus bendigoensis DSM 12906]|uniref:Glycine/D-amino acid oxidase n=1 Tax=Tessaracoccus bendigoensis DSM 12906 TaxID=1123357 RepID=A0A1M6MTN9_9ACTN|nr:FAD-dependent oxidoreductase [Tessaracoccus bendigoensis]SHJ86834.1 Glycine/D-amino acid oxidase [Tessaracoccus bendigoensis DSM 12906]
MAHDVLVLGATVAGLTVARRLARIGYDVVVLDPNAEALSASIGHGVAAVGHGSTIANMAHAYGVPAAREHIERNLAGMREIARNLPDATKLPLRDRSLPGRDEEESRRIVALLREAGASAELIVSPEGPTIISEALCVDPTAYAGALRAAAVAEGAQIVESVTVTHLTRREGSTRVRFLDNRAWVREPKVISGVAVVDTLGISPWGRAARVGPAQWVPFVRGVPAKRRQEVTLESGSTVWMVRPVDDGVLVLGQKASLSQIDSAADELRRFVTDEMGLRDPEPGRLAIDPSDHGRPVVGASAIPGGFYARGNGRGELMNGTASGYYLYGLLSGRRDSGNALPPLTQLKAAGARLFRRR